MKKARARKRERGACGRPAGARRSQPPPAPLAPQIGAPLFARAVSHGRREGHRSKGGQRRRRAAPPARAERPRPRDVGALRGGRARPPGPPPPPPSDLGAVRVVAMWGEGGEGGADTGGGRAQRRGLAGQSWHLGARARTHTSPAPFLPPTNAFERRPRRGGRRMRGQARRAGGRGGATPNDPARQGPPRAAVGAPRTQPPRPRARAVEIMLTLWRAILKSAGE